MGLRLSARDAGTGAVVYAAGDSLAALLVGEASWARLATMALVGGTLYALEIPNYFRWIDRRSPETLPALRRALLRTALALVYFNPLWIARHLLFIAVARGAWDALSWQLLGTGALSWALNIPLSALGNYVIQVRVPLRWRFLASAVFSGLLAVYYALSGVWLHG